MEPEAKICPEAVLGASTVLKSVGPVNCPVATGGPVARGMVPGTGWVPAVGGTITLCIASEARPGREALLVTAAGLQGWLRGKTNDEIS